YRKPGAVLLALRNHVVGPETFDRAFREYTRRWAFKHPTPGDFFRTIENVSGMELGWYWRSFFYTTDVLDIGIDSASTRTTADGGRLVLAAGVRALVDGGRLAVERGSVLVDDPEPRTLVVDGVQAVGRGTWRVDAGPQPRLATYRGDVSASDGSDEVALSGFEQLAVRDRAVGGTPASRRPRTSSSSPCANCACTRRSTRSCARSRPSAPVGCTSTLRSPTCSSGRLPDATSA
ncbi:MAG: hypothetical protein KY442_11110, partial [Proteobacteria bacterium]|nr:hypothetical protein [Pseudomonadota bacterium]